jgi:hypothetical protein
MKALRLLAVILVALVASACDETRFETDIAANADSAALCRRDLAGNWRIDDDNAKGADYLVIGADCGVRFFTTRRDNGVDTPVVIAFKPHVLAAGRKIYLTLGDDDFHRIGDSSVEPPDASARGHAIENAGFHYYVIAPKRDRLRLYGVDHEAVARAIIAGDVKGEVHKVDDQLHNVVRGDAERIDKLVHERWVFQSRNPLTLTRVDVAALPVPVRAALDDEGTP